MQCMLDATEGNVLLWIKKNCLSRLKEKLKKEKGSSTKSERNKIRTFHVMEIMHLGEEGAEVN